MRLSVQSDKNYFVLDDLLQWVNEMKYFFNTHAWLQQQAVAIPFARFEELRFPQCPARVISGSFSSSASGAQSLRASPMGTLSASLSVRMMSRSTCVSRRGF
jgi:hypothetical protein